MASSIDTYLRDLSYSFYLKKDSTEISKINTSKTNLLANLDKELGILIKRRFVFGSYDRDTILPRSIDSKSDIDIMVVFNHTDYERTPETYRAWLINFGDKYYKNRYGSEVVRSFPTVTIRLGNIHFDLVPAKEESIYPYIPGAYGWQSTDPNDVKTKLTEANTKYNQVVRPIIRLLKAWNCTHGYPFDSYQLELEITQMNFHGDNVQSGFFWAVRHLSTSWSDPQTKTDKINSLRYNIDKVAESLEAYDVTAAKRWLHRVLPYG
ncbi:MAG: nucleotidyltransferase domain-containing protein [Ignavibacteriales bacterium]|nr:nucleotidyltransferase domain-containing protein [Melioribacteraceae bacterium]MCF8316616.1 nucleotidyltransferase domain-containing protein [Ignavibacteriales bacterium]MCF8438264.1 nucleotidyltransferase domain-containing protein [Ignavibacteriales bacterium]